MYKDVFIYIDGTLRDNKKSISQRTIEAIKLVTSKNILVVICSGRPRKYTENVSRECNASKYIISSNGGSIYNYENKNVIYENIMDKHACIELYNIAKKAGVNFAMNVDDGRVVTKLDKDDNTEQLLKTNIESFVYKNNIVQCIILDDDYNKIKNLYSDIIKVKNAAIKNQHKSLIDSGSPRTGNIYYDITDENTNKGNAILEFCKALNIRLSDTIAIGNDYNDVPMFKVAGYSVAMKNSDDEVKKYADYVTESNDDDGVAIFLENLINFNNIYPK